MVKDVKEKPIWVGPTLHNTIKVEAAKNKVTMRHFIANLLKKHLEGEK